MREPTAEIGSVPEAWPLMLNREQLCAYLTVSSTTLSRICPVAPVALGARVLRWRRHEIDVWVAGLPSRLMATVAWPDETPPPAELAGQERRSDAVERAQQRAARRPEARTWKRTTDEFPSSKRSKPAAA